MQYAIEYGRNRGNKKNSIHWQIFVHSFITKAVDSRTGIKAKDNSIFTVTSDSYEEKELEIPVFSDEDVQLVCQQAGVDEEKAKNALVEAKGDLARAILLLTTG